VSNRNLTAEELKRANELLGEITLRMRELANGDPELLFAYRRKVAKELTYQERGKPMHRRELKARKREEQGELCARCSEPLPNRGAILDRIEAMKGYTPENTRLLCPICDTATQAEREYR
jgi:rubrerythrin